MTPAVRLMVPGIAAVLATLGAVLVPGAAKWLVRARHIGRCDLMVVPAGGALERLSTAASLMEGGACGKILFTGGDPRERLANVYEVMAGISANTRVPAPGTAGTTFEDALVSLRAAENGGFRYLLVITSPYHTRRAEWIFSRVFAGTGVRFGIYPSASFYMDYDHWWAGWHGLGAVTGEYVKLWLCALAETGFRARAAWAASVA